MRFLLFAAGLCGCGGTIASGTDASSTGDAGADVATRGSVYFQMQNGAGPTENFFRATFYASAQQGGACKQTMSASGCSVASCAQAPPAASSLLNAGALTLFGGSYGGATATQGGDGNYMLVGTFSANDVLGVSGSGGDVPAFGTQTVVAPGMITLTSPLGATVSTASDLVVAWTGGEPNAQVLFEAYGTGNNGATLVACTFDATAGTGTMPATFLANVKGTSGSLIGSQSRVTTFVAGDYPIALAAIQFAMAPTSFQ